MKIEQDKVAMIEYTLKDANGEVMDASKWSSFSVSSRSS
jgi:FKBP-type peptidyl-prolyl cis-trans isomerase 2